MKRIEFLSEKKKTNETFFLSTWCLQLWELFMHVLASAALPQHIYIIISFNRFSGL